MRLLVPAFALLLTSACTSSTAAKKPTAAESSAPAPAPEERVYPDPRTDPLEAPANVSAPPPDAWIIEGGVATILLQRGTGTEHPSTFSEVRVHYTGWTTDGQRFDSSVERGEPAEFPLSGVILGWRYGVKAMVVGEKRRFWIPEHLAYKGMSGPQGMLVFDVELLEITKP